MGAAGACSVCAGAPPSVVGDGAPSAGKAPSAGGAGAPSAAGAPSVGAGAPSGAENDLVSIERQVWRYSIRLKI